MLLLPLSALGQQQCVDLLLCGKLFFLLVVELFVDRVEELGHAQILALDSLDALTHLSDLGLLSFLGQLRAFNILLGLLDLLPVFGSLVLSHLYLDFDVLDFFVFEFDVG